uniref:Peptidase C1A papain C-terminal domain-containing protein n=1 Tax=Oryza rufipogon TaxID=4529 RepID=A0A0E0R7J6_ORYRU
MATFMACASPPVLALALLASCGAFLATSMLPARATAGSCLDVGDMVMMDRFRAWQGAHNRSYPSAEEEMQRFDFFDAVNLRGDLTYQLAENEFADLTEEFLATYTGYYIGDGPVDDFVITTGAGDVDASFSYRVDVPASVDWRAQGAVVPPKSQTSTCSSCWAFVTAATIESLNMIKTRKLVSLSEQQLVDCDSYDGGCNLGSYGRAYKWVVENGGLTTEADYPYTARRGPCNRAKSAHHAAKITGFGKVTPRNEAALQAAVARQPVAVAIEVGSGMQFYKGGVYTGPCGTCLAHAVTVVGTAPTRLPVPSTGPSRTHGASHGASAATSGFSATSVAPACVASHSMSPTRP